ncbi:type-F conjugative transfer system pilin assembly protein TrbC [Cronobacter dublinensis]|uniref:type-F conjugative transfer system pilin assembly protein TrbC n=1 Tax=Cronobacter dublinensis TaxID=413497 RepID=UPI000CFC444D|nr:type-F conjugative transfer system pilin assembly protein TrbC [Cronobacter dublinensis]
MKISILRTLTLGGLLFSMSVQASAQNDVSASDRAWMKRQQDELQSFKDSLTGQNIQLPPAQQYRISQSQQQMATDGAVADENRKPLQAVYFVSLAIPREGLVPMLKDAQRYHIPATIRGLVNNDMRKTAAAMFELSKIDNSLGVQVDPTLFSDYGVTAVPALVVTCPGHFDVIRGSLPLQQALERVAQEGDCASAARKLLGAEQ